MKLVAMSALGADVLDITSSSLVKRILEVFEVPERTSSIHLSTI